VEYFLSLELIKADYYQLFQNWMGELPHQTLVLTGAP